MGTTIVVKYFHENQLYVGNVGDSRCYLINQKKLYQISKDHSLVQEKINLGIYGREEAKKDKMKNVLVKTVGFEAKVDIDVFNYQVLRNDMFLICSDGLHAKVTDHDILYIINSFIPDASKASQDSVEKTVTALIAQANENGGQDNISRDSLCGPIIPQCNFF